MRATVPHEPNSAEIHKKDIKGNAKHFMCARDVSTSHMSIKIYYCEYRVPNKC